MSETTKANPNAAIHEAQPSRNSSATGIYMTFTNGITGALALEQSTLQTLNNIRCTDIYGKPIGKLPLIRRFKSDSLTNAPQSRTR
jgi:hypothetical protein